MLVLPAVFSQFFQLKILNVILVKEGQLDEIAEVTECHSANENDTVYTPQFYEGSYDKTFDRSNSGDREVSFRESAFFICFLCRNSGSLFALLAEIRPETRVTISQLIMQWFKLIPSLFYVG